MQQPPLEKVLEKLEKLDIREWKADENRLNCFIARTSGLTVSISTFSDMGTKYKLELVKDNGARSFWYRSYDKQYKDMLKKFYDKIQEGYEKIQEEEFEEMIKYFLSE